MEGQMNASRVVSGVVLAAFLGLSPGASAQVQRGSIYGNVTDNSGAVLPGATVQLTSTQTAARETVTGAQGEFRFENLDPGEYNLRVTLASFTPYVRERVIVGVGTNVELKMEMSVAGVQEEVRVTAETPMLDTRTQGNVAHFDQAMLNEVPTARDPWALLQFVPGVQLDRINVGGSESGQQSVFSARGDDGTNTMWNIDGVTITDPAAIGSSPTYYDFSTFEEVQFTTSGQDPRQQTAGLGINFVTKRGTNDFRGQARLYFTHDDLQGTNIPSDLEALGFRGNGIAQIAEYGGDIGGPILRDRLWFWGAWAKNDIRQIAITGRPDDTELDNTSAKVNAQLATSNEFNFFYYRGEKTKIGRNAGVTRPPETTWDQTGPTSIFKFEDSHVFGPALMLSGKFAYIDGGFSFQPQGGMNAQLWRDFGGGNVNHGSYYQYVTDRPQYQTNVDGSWYAGRNELRFGFQYRRTPVSSITRWPGNQTWSIVNLEALDIPSGIGWAEITRAADVQLEMNTTSFYVGDIVTLGYWTINAGARFDRQNGENLPSTGPANDLAPGIVPALNYPGAPPVFTWNDVSPRIGATYRVNDSTIVKASYGMFAEQLRSTYVAFDNPVQLAAIEYYFQDANGDNIPQAGELLTATGSSYGIDPDNPSAPFSPNQVDPDLRAPLTHSVVAGVEHELARNLTVGVNGGWGYITRTIWAPFRDLTRTDYVQTGVAGSAGGVTSDTPVYELREGVSLPPGRGIFLTNRDGYHIQSWNVDFVATKRLADRWMLRGSFTVQNNQEYFDDPNLALQDPTSRAVTTETPLFIPPSPAFDGGIVATSAGGGSGPRGDVFIHSRWSYSAMAMYQLPWDVSLAGTVYGRQGYPNPEYISVNRGALGTQTQVLVDADLDNLRYDSVHMVDLRAQKAFKMGRLNATLDVDLFNAFNTNTTLQQNRQADSTTFRQAREIIAPRVLRFGFRLMF
jgi:hypothetical protein